MSKLNIIVAYNQQHVIGKDNTMPWKLPADLAYFKQITMGCPIIMGRKTRDSLGRPLPGRLNIVISRDANFQAEGTQTVTSLEEAIAVAKASQAENIFVIGGGQIYQDALPHVQRVYATEIHSNMDGDTYFPVLEKAQWKEVSRHPQPEQNGLAFDFVVYERL